jgi:hypothetical protein
MFFSEAIKVNGSGTFSHRKQGGNFFLFTLSKDENLFNLMAQWVGARNLSDQKVNGASGVEARRARKLKRICRNLRRFLVTNPMRQKRLPHASPLSCNLTTPNRHDATSFLIRFRTKLSFSRMEINVTVK